VDVVNIEAVRKAYIDGSLEIRPGYWTYWVGGGRNVITSTVPKQLVLPRMKFFCGGSKRRMDIACGWRTQFVLIFPPDSVYKD